VIVEPLAGAALSSVQTLVRELATELSNARGTTGSPRDRYANYIAWANMSVRKLGNVVTAESLERLVLTRRYWLLQSIADQSDARSVIHVLDVELAEREKVLEAVMEELAVGIARWSRTGRWVVPDTSFFIEHPEKLEDLALVPILKIREDPVRLVVPILVVDELDGLKRSGQRDVRWRAAYTLSVLDRLLPSPSTPGVVRRENFDALQHGGFSRGEVTIEVVLDPAGHARLPINDDEIVDRALAIRALVNRRVTMLTYDTSQAFRARGAQLQVVKLSKQTDQTPP
jgi:hypothetical protein